MEREVWTSPRLFSLRSSPEEGGVRRVGGDLRPVFDDGGCAAMRVESDAASWCPVGHHPSRSPDPLKAGGKHHHAYPIAAGDV